MKKHLLTFIFTFFFSFVVFVVMSGILVSADQLTDREHLEIFLLLTGGSGFLAGANMLYSIFSKAEDARAIGEFTQEIMQSGSLFVQASRLLFSLRFFPLWLVLLTFAGAQFYLFHALPMVALFLVLLAQFFWFLWRRRLFRLSDTKAVSIPLYTPLRLLLRGVDILSALMVVSMVGVLREFAFIQQPLRLMGISFVIALGILAWDRGGMKNILRADLPIFLAPLFLWINVVIASLNFALNLSAPTIEVEVSYRDCPGASNRMLTVGGKEIHGPLPDAVYYGCQFLEKRAAVGLQSTIKILHYRGALGIGWLSASRN